MAEKILIMGESGSGKSHSMKNLNPEETFVVCIDQKTLPFKGAKKKYVTNFTEEGKIDGKTTNYIETSDFGLITRTLENISKGKPEIKTIILDTITNGLNDSWTNRAKETGWDKFTDFALELTNLINLIPKLRTDLTVVFMSHYEEETDSDGVRKRSFKVPAGKIAKKQIPESKFTMVLYTDVVSADGKNTYRFVTQTNGRDTCKSPEGMFPELHIPNDLQYVLDCMHAHYNDENPPIAPWATEEKETEVEQK